MKRIYALLQMARLFRVCGFLFILTFILSTAGTAFGQSWLDQCKGTKQAIDRYRSDYYEINNTLYAVENPEAIRAFLSKVNSAIANGRVVSEVFPTAQSMGLTVVNLELLYAPGSPETLALEKRVRDAIVAAIERGKDSNGPELRSQLEEILKQIKIRQNRMTELDCEKVLNQTDKPAANQPNGIANFTGLWTQFAANQDNGRVRLVQTGNQVTGTVERRADGVNWSATGRIFDGVANYVPPKPELPRGGWSLVAKFEESWEKGTLTWTLVLNQDPDQERIRGAYMGGLKRVLK